MDFPPPLPAIVQIIEKQDLNSITSMSPKLQDEYKYSQEFYDFINKHDVYKNYLDFFEQFSSEDKRMIEAEMLNLPYKIKVIGDHPVPDEVIKFIKGNWILSIMRFDKVRYEKHWNGYNVYYASYCSEIGEDNVCVVYIILEKYGDVRFATDKEIYKISKREK